MNDTDRKVCLFWQNIYNEIKLSAVINKINNIYHM